MASEPEAQCRPDNEKEQSKTTLAFSAGVGQRPERRDQENGENIRVRHYKAGHTDGDISVYLSTTHTIIVPGHGPVGNL